MFRTAEMLPTYIPPKYERGDCPECRMWDWDGCYDCSELHAAQWATLDYQEKYPDGGGVLWFCLDCGVPKNTEDMATWTPGLHVEGTGANTGSCHDCVREQG